LYLKGTLSFFAAALFFAAVAGFFFGPPFFAVVAAFTIKDPPRPKSFIPTFFLKEELGIGGNRDYRLL
jgi:hypothetical protein